MPPPDERTDAVVDEQIARRVIAGERSAEQELCRRVLPRVRAWGLKHLRDEAGARDLAQEVTLVLLEALREGRVHHPSRLGPYLLGVCKLTVVAWRRGERRRTNLLEVFGPTFADVTQPPADAGLDRARLAGCLEALAPRARTALALTFYAERPGDEIARQLAVTPEALRQLRHRALRQLQTCMDGET